MKNLLDRLQRGERCWPVEIGMRTAGLALLLLCGLTLRWLATSLHTPRLHAPLPGDYAEAALAMLAWSSGCCLLVHGPGLLRLVTVPAKYRRWTPTEKSRRH